MLNFLKQKNADEKKTPKKVYSELIKKYTSIPFSYEAINENIKQELSGKFLDRFDCSMYLVPRNVYALRFKDNIGAGDFETIFDSLKADLGEPDFYAEYEGYIWILDGGLCITFGLVSLNYNYEVPMLCVRKRRGLFSAPYEKYRAIAEGINKPLNDRGIFPQREQYFPINYTREFGYFVIATMPSGMLNINFKGAKLELAYSAFKPYGEYKMIDKENSIKKQINKVSVSKIEEALDCLLEETKDHHGLVKEKN